MKAIIKIEKEVDVQYVTIAFPVRNNEDLSFDFPLRKDDMWKATVHIDTQKIVGWPEGREGDFEVKVVDCGQFSLLDADMNVISSIEDASIPSKLIPSEYGDYINLEINKEGIILNWKLNPSFEDFPGFEICE